MLVQNEMVVFRRRGITDPTQIKNPQMPRLRIPKCKDACSITNPQMQKCPNPNIYIQARNEPPRVSTRTCDDLLDGAACEPLMPPQPSANRTVADLHAPVMSSSKEPRASRTCPPARWSTPVRYPSSAAGCWMEEPRPWGREVGREATAGLGGSPQRRL
jgi:hypothetical protein